MAKTYGNCRIINCWKPALYRGSGLCGACYQNIRLHQIQTPTEIMEWSRRVERMRSRVQLLTGGVKARLRRVK